MRNKVFLFVFCGLILLVMIAAPLNLALTNAGVVEKTNVGNVIEVEKVYEEGAFGAKLLNGIEEAKRGVREVYTNYLPFYVGVTSAAKEMTSAINRPVSGFLMDQLGMTVLFPYAVFFVILSFLTMLFVKHGDSKPEAKRGLSALEDMDAD